VTAPPPQPFADSAEHILAEMKRLDLMLRRAVLVARQARATDTPDEFRGLVISEQTVDHMLDSVDFLGDMWKLDGSPAAVNIDQELETRQEEIRDRMQATAQAGIKLTLAHLAAVCDLSPAEVDVLLVALSAELETRYETLFAYLQNDVTRKRPSVDLCLNLVCRTEQEKLQARHIFSPDAPLLYFHLIQLHEESYDRNSTELRHFLKLDDAVTEFLLERQPLQTSGGQLLAAHNVIADLETSSATRTELANLAGALEPGGLEHAVVQLWGADDAPLKEAALALAHSLEKNVLYADLARLEPDAAKLGALIRDAALWDNLLVLDRGRPESREAERDKKNQAEEIFLARVMESSIQLIVLSRGEQFGPLGGSTSLWRVHVRPTDFDAREAAWQAALGPAVAEMDTERLADLFLFSGLRIQQTVSLAHARAVLRDPAAPQLTMADLLAAGRDLTTPNLQRFAVAVEPRYGWDDLVLPAEQIKQLHGISARLQFRSIVYRNWGFGKNAISGRGLSVMFTGPTGTGKTMAAEVLARDLSLALFQIDLSAVVSKYIGETEERLSTIFREAELSQSLLFFDEADALFGKRTEVKDAHDRYANIEVNYLLQRIEQYQGLVVLATNFQENIDDAFLRRLQSVIRFPFPDDLAREQIWKLQFSPKAPLAAPLDFKFLAAQFKLTGANIRSIALEAAFLAAQEGGAAAKISMDDIIAAVKHEHQKQGKLVMKGDLGKYSKAS